MQDNMQEQFGENKKVKSGKDRISTVCMCVAMVTVLCIGCLWTFLNLYSYSRSVDSAEQYERDLLQEYETGVDNYMAEVLDGIYSVRKIYRIADSRIVMPEPDQNAFAADTDPQEVEKVIAQAEEYGLCSGDDLYFSKQHDKVLRGTDVVTYLDKSILTISWHREMGNALINYTEVVIGHPSQFRKYLTENQYGSRVRKTVSSLSGEVNAVIGMSADFYGYRNGGVVVYNGVHYRNDSPALDACYIDGNGNLILSRRGELLGDEIPAFVKENDIRFSLSFGPILVEDHKMSKLVREEYPLGETEDKYSRAAIGQLGELHYLLVTVDGGTESFGEVRYGANVIFLAERMQEAGCEKAYTLDGGQTATMTVNGEIFNHVGYGSERPVSDIIFFASAMSNDE